MGKAYEVIVSETLFFAEFQTPRTRQEKIIFPGNNNETYENYPGTMSDLRESVLYSVKSYAELHRFQFRYLYQKKKTEMQER